MGFLKKLRKAKLGKVLTSTVGKTIGDAVTGGLYSKGVKLAQKGISAKKKVATLIGKPKPVPAPTAGVPDVKATAMPGGSPIRRKSRKKASSGVAKAKAAPKAAKSAKTAPRPKSGGGRKPPTGGKDLKALSVSWKKAGKPGKWLDWVKAA